MERDEFGPVNKLKTAIWSRDISNVESTYNEVYPLVNDKNELNLTNHAIKLGDVEMTKFFISKHPNVNYIGSEDYHYPIHAAVIREDPELVSLLLEKGADVHTKTQDPFQDTALHVAAKTGSATIAKLLIDGGADKNSKNSLGHLPIDYAENEQITATLK
ncbi:hypothetical protein AKO1_014401 [Acrasis kona]|uniref:Myotrophin n=1 Tax=Acrasis kona TaxID=1008807 RepID=A0AAW2YZC2_9EUKA